jgi:Domain of unknown function (DUF4388)
MPVSGRLSTFSLPEVLQFLQEGSKTGLLTVRSRSETAPELHPPELHPPELERYFIWLNQGRIVAAADRMDYRGLVEMIGLRKWIAEMELNRLVQECPLRTPFGLYLKSQNLLSGEQMKLLFSVQIIRQICGLFELTDGSFNFMRNVQLPYLEMTGISIPATDIALPGLRSLRNWSALEPKLPLPTSTILRTVQGAPPVKLNDQELKVWAFTDGRVSIAEMVKNLDLPVETVRRTAFCLTVAGLAEEVPLRRREPRAVSIGIASPASPVGTVKTGPALTSVSPSQAFLDKVSGFLQRKAQQNAIQDKTHPTHSAAISITSRL